MWKPENRVAADRHGLRYPSDLSDREWSLIEPMIPPAKHGGQPAQGKWPRGFERELLRAFDGLQMAGAFKGPVAEEHVTFLVHAEGLKRHIGAYPSRALCRHAECEGHAASPTAASSTGQSVKAAKKGAPHLTRRFLMRARRSQGSIRHFLVDNARLSLERRRPFCRRAGPRRRTARARSSHATPLRLHRSGLRRCWIRDRVSCAPAAQIGHWVVEIVKRNRTAQVRHPEKTSDCRAHFRVDQPQSSSGARLRALRPKRRCVRATRHDSHHAMAPDPGKAFLMNRNFMGSVLRELFPGIDRLGKYRGRRFIESHWLERAVLSPLRT